MPDEPEPSTAVILVEDKTLKDAASVFPKITAVVPVKFVPVMVTVEPAFAVEVFTEVIVGIGTVTVTDEGEDSWLTVFRLRFTEYEPC